MTTQEIIDYYAGLLIRQYLGLTKATLNIEALVGPLLVPQGHDILTDNDGEPLKDNDGDLLFTNTTEPIIPLAIAQAFDINTAIGNQLLLIGKYVGVSNQGQDFSGFITLNDDQYRQIMKIVAVRNILKGTTFAINNFIFEFFSDVLQVIDDLAMHMTYFYSAEIGQNIVAEFFIKAGLLPKPLAVGRSIVYTFPYTGQKFYGFRRALTPPPSYISPVSTTSNLLTGHVLTTQDFINV
jgi:hypothetical protein